MQRPLPESERSTQDDAYRLGREIWWAILLVGFVVLVASTQVTTYLGSRGRGRAAIWEVWRDLTNDLPGNSSGLTTFVYLMIVAVFVITSFLGLWLALTADGSDEPDLQTEPSLPVRENS